ncbi:MAG: type I DNA topoisomerase [Pseudomonadota bacterium]
MDVVIVESPAKAKTINKYLGGGYHVLASYGHVRDLPSKDGSVEPDKDFEMHWATDSASQKRLKEIADAVKGANKLYLATDPDREGEAISWHVLDVLKKKRALKDVEVSRIVFNEITKAAVTRAIQNPRELDDELINAYLARRALDYLVGFTLSPVLWRKLPGARSAGRVQSVALRLICERETEIEIFEPREYWTVDTDAKNASDDPFKARLTHLDGKKLDKFTLNDAEKAARAKSIVEQGAFTLTSLEQKPARRNPSPPFTTSTLQQEASRKLGFSAKRTMQVAQKLYEGARIDADTVGLITYMRTDGVQIADEALRAVRDVIARDYGDRSLPKSPRLYKTKAKNAQEAHEAIRPTGFDRPPARLKSVLDDDGFKLYDLIWKRTVASQMESAIYLRTTADFTTADGSTALRATGSVLQFAGYEALYREGRDDDGESDDAKRLPELTKGEPLNIVKVNADQHFTEPPPRFSEASLVKRLEELGIGRPSTYASILSVLSERSYVRLEAKRFFPEDKGRLVTAFLEKFFERYVEYSFTADLEGQLDEVSAGERDWKALLRAFWEDFSRQCEETIALKNADVLDALNDYLGPFIFGKADDEDGDPRKCPVCDTGRLSLKTGRYGAFVGCSNYPECRFTRQFSDDGSAEATQTQDGPKVLGEHPESGVEITLRDGRFGPYLQLGEAAEGEKPKRASIPKDVPLESLDFGIAVKLIDLPRNVGTHPETGEMITAAIGRYGPYLSHDKKTARLGSTEEVLTIGLNRAVVVLAEAKPGRGRAATPAALKSLGDHPDGGEVTVRDGRYGPYVNWGKVNASLPKGEDPQSIEMDRAIELLNARIEKTGKKPPKAKKPATKSKAKTKPKAKTGTKAKATSKSAKAKAS